MSGGLMSQPKLAELTRAKEKVRALRKALVDILEECPKPTLPYAWKVNEIAQKALREN